MVTREITRLQVPSQPWSPVWALSHQPVCPQPSPKQALALRGLGAKKGGVAGPWPSPQAPDQASGSNNSGSTACTCAIHCGVFHVCTKYRHLSPAEPWWSHTWCQCGKLCKSTSNACMHPLRFLGSSYPLSGPLKSHLWSWGDNQCIFTVCMS